MPKRGCGLIWFAQRAAKRVRLPRATWKGLDSIAERRVSELRCAAGILGLTGFYFLDYRDSGMQGSEDNLHPQALINAPLEEVAGRVVSHIRRLQPQILITFDPIGGYMHPDHIAIHRATVRAFYLAGNADYCDPEKLPPFQPQKLYYSVFPKGVLKLAARLMPLFGRDPRKFGRNGDIDFLAIVEQGDFPVHARIDTSEAAEARAAAAACHASQLDGGPPNRGPIGWIWKKMGSKDSFMRAYPEVVGKVKERDLFDGVEPTP